MRNINEVVLSGNLINDPKKREYNGTTFTDIMVAANRKAYQVNGEWKQDTDFIPVSCGGKVAEKIATLTKGSSVVLRGSLESYNYKKDDQTVYGLRVHLSELISSSAKKEEN